MVDTLAFDDHPCDPQSQSHRVTKNTYCIHRHRDMWFLRLLEQFGEAVPQFVIALTFYINHKVI